MARRFVLSGLRVREFRVTALGPGAGKFVAAAGFAHRA
jgi:hypothetical protein